MTAFDHILFPTDGSELSDKAAEFAIGLASDLGARLTALHVISPYAPPMDELSSGYITLASPAEYDKAARQESAGILALVAERARKRHVQCDILSVVAPNPWDSIVNTAKAGKCDLIAMASHGRRGLSALLGSETHKVLAHCRIPILVCR
jgi:nucleotide-binding universal stress UspA family protein